MRNTFGSSVTFQALSHAWLSYNNVYSENLIMGVEKKSNFLSSIEKKGALASRPKACWWRTEIDCESTLEGWFFYEHPLIDNTVNKMANTVK